MGDYPQWWVDRGVISSGTNSAPNDFALANQGQLKWMAIQCAKEFESRLTNGAGPEIWGVIAGFDYTNNNAVLNIGQLKKTVQPFYDRLYPDCTDAYPKGLSGKYPWTVPDGLRNDYSAVNIGQLKKTFSFDLAGAGLGTSDVISVSGSISYSGGQQGNVIVLISLDQAGWGRAYSTQLAQLGGYTLSGLPEGRTGWVRAFLDTDGNGKGNGSEPWGAYISNPLLLESQTMGGGINNINITLTDAGNDADSMDDWWELNHFGDLSQNDTTDFDNDGLLDCQEYLGGTDPTDADTDGDGLEDNEDPNPLTADADGNGLSDTAEAELSSSTNSYGTDGVLIHVPDRGWYHAVETNLTLIPLGE